MKNITVDNYKKDHYYTKIVNAFTEINKNNSFISPLLIFESLELLNQSDIDKWKQGNIPYLEKVIHCNLSKASIILRIISFHAHDLNMKRSITVYRRKIKGKVLLLKFTKTGDTNIEKAYSTHFFNTKKDRKETLL